MMANHKQFVEAIQEKKEVCVWFYSKADSAATPDGVNRYSLWDETKNKGSHTLSFLPEQVLDMRIPGEVFDPAKIDAKPPHWFIARGWGSQPNPADAADGRLVSALPPSLSEPLAGGRDGLRTIPAETN